MNHILQPRKVASEVLKQGVERHRFVYPPAAFDARCFLGEADVVDDMQ